MKIAIGIVVDGDEIFDSLVITNVYSTLKNLTSPLVSRILICCDSHSRFLSLKETLCVFTKLPVVEVIPTDFFSSQSELFPAFSNSSLATYWKFFLFDQLKVDESLFFMDLDAICLSPFSLVPTIHTLQSRSLPFAAVPAHRPIVERFTSIPINSPFNYFNAGVFIYCPSDTLDWQTLCYSFAQDITQNDPLGLHWHDQDLLNCIFSNHYFRLFLFSTFQQVGFYPRNLAITTFLLDTLSIFFPI